MNLQAMTLPVHEGHPIKVTILVLRQAVEEKVHTYGSIFQAYGSP